MIFVFLLGIPGIHFFHIFYSFEDLYLDPRAYVYICTEYKSITGTTVLLEPIIFTILAAIRQLLRPAAFSQGKKYVNFPHPLQQSEILQGKKIDRNAK